MKKTNAIMILLLVVSLIIASGCASSGKAGLKIGLGCGTHEEKYTSNEKGCENMEKCKCIHNNFFNACDNCECAREVNDC